MPSSSPLPVLASTKPPHVQASSIPLLVSAQAFTEEPLSVPAVAGPNLRHHILPCPSHNASGGTFFLTPSRDASTTSTTSCPSYDHRFPTLMDVTLFVGTREKGAACMDGTPPAYHWLPGFWDGSDKWLLHLEVTASVSTRYLFDVMCQRR
ncbi:pectin acetylesterase 5-like [Hordeum vulgare]|nr:pectin acetylesterase 5-like [Hordeum vulgare]